AEKPERDPTVPAETGGLNVGPTTEGASSQPDGVQPQAEPETPSVESPLVDPFNDPDPAPGGEMDIDDFDPFGSSRPGPRDPRSSFVVAAQPQRVRSTIPPAPQVPPADEPPALELFPPETTFQASRQVDVNAGEAYASDVAAGEVYASDAEDGAGYFGDSMTSEAYASDDSEASEAYVSDVQATDAYASDAYAEDQQAALSHPELNHAIAVIAEDGDRTKRWQVGSQEATTPDVAKETPEDGAGRATRVLELPKPLAEDAPPPLPASLRPIVALHEQRAPVGRRDANAVRQPPVALSQPLRVRPAKTPPQQAPIQQTGWSQASGIQLVNPAAARVSDGQVEQAIYVEATDR
ncbi:MAG: hypothetical protein AAF961_14285, partial [Planctomycetota bacterium]